MYFPLQQKRINMREQRSVLLSFVFVWMDRKQMEKKNSTFNNQTRCKSHFFLRIQFQSCKKWPKHKIARLFSSLHFYPHLTIQMGKLLKFPPPLHSSFHFPQSKITIEEPFTEHTDCWFCQCHSHSSGVFSINPNSPIRFHTKGHFANIWRNPHQSTLAPPSCSVLNF